MSKSFLSKLMDKLRYGSEKEIDDDPEQILTTEKPAAEQTKDNDEAVFEEKVDNHSELSAYKNAKKHSVQTPVSNIVELNELSIQAIINAMSAIRYSDVRLSEIHLHVRKDKQDPTSLAVESLFNSEKFMENLKYKLTDAGIHYMDDLKVKINYSSPDVDRYTILVPDLSIRTLTFEEAKKLQKLIITALTGILWEKEIELVPRKKPYFIGRCKMPELDKTGRIINDIAFVGPEENDDPQYEVNRFVSRSIAKICYNEKTGCFELMRSNLINNKQHVIKIVRIADGVQQISINNTEVGYPLQDDDQIVFNDRVALLVNTAEIDAK